MLLACALILTSCDKPVDKTAALNKGAVLAEVNGHKIYAQDLENTLIDMFGAYQASTLEKQGREKALQSLVASRAMADLAVKTIDKQQLEFIEAKAKRYHENLIINAYVKHSVVPEPLSNKMVEDYYNGHLEKFGQKQIRQYELLSTQSALPVDTRDKFLKAFEQVKQLQPAKIQQQLKKQGYDLLHHKGVTGESLLEPKLRDLIAAQKLNVLSNITFIDGKAFAVLVNSDITQPAKPLSEVREYIRKSLAMIQLKNAIKSLSETAVKQASISYPDGKKN